MNRNDVQNLPVGKEITKTSFAGRPVASGAGRGAGDDQSIFLREQSGQRRRIGIRTDYSGPKKLDHDFESNPW
jgi:hypothetical protein